MIKTSKYSVAMVMTKIPQVGQPFGLSALGGAGVRARPSQYLTHTLTFLLTQPCAAAYN